MVTIARLKEKRGTTKFFKQELLKEFNAYNVDSPTGRKYVTPDGEFTSVTTFLSSFDKDSDFLEKWAERLGGKDKAEIELKRCTDRGEGVHLALEYLLQNDPKPEHAGKFQNMYKQLETVLNIHVDDIHGIEIPLWSKMMALAGRVDCIAKYKGRLSIIDFKTSTNSKKTDWITNYFLQATCYSIMLEELYGLRATQIVIMIAIEKGTKPQVFVRERRDFMPLLLEKLKDFRDMQKKQPTNLFEFGN